jgi:hypothetical protein
MSEKSEWDLSENVDPSKIYKVCAVSINSNPQKKLFIITKKDTDDLLCNHIHEKEELWKHLQYKELNEGLCPKCSPKSHNVNAITSSNKNSIDYRFPKGINDWSELTFDGWRKIKEGFYFKIRDHIWWIQRDEEIVKSIIEKYISDYMESQKNVPRRQVLNEIYKMIFLRPSAPNMGFDWLQTVDYDEKKDIDISLITVERTNTEKGYEIDTRYGFISVTVNKSNIFGSYESGGQYVPSVTVTVMVYIRKEKREMPYTNFIENRKVIPPTKEYKTVYRTTSQNIPPGAIVVKP